MTEEKKELTDQEFEMLFKSDKLRDRVNSKNHSELSKLYESTMVEMPKDGDVVNGEYIGLSGDNYVFHVKGFKDDVRVDNKPGESRYLSNLEIGDMVDVLITKITHGEFFIKGSISALYESRAHTTLQSLSSDQSVDAYIKSLNPAGYDVDLLHNGVILPAFMPKTLAGINKLHDPSFIVGQTFEVMIESYADREGTYIVSRRKYLQSLIPEAVKELSYDMPYTGMVTGTAPFGVFVEFNECLTGMIHKANIHPEWQERISEIKPGFEIEFYVKEIIKNGKFHKIILTQILRETLWDSVEDNQVIQGTVRDIKPFGILVNLDEETVGLIHKSEMDKMKVKLTQGDPISVRVLSVDRQIRKIFLTESK